MSRIKYYHRHAEAPLGVDREVLLRYVNDYNSANDSLSGL